MIIINIKKNIIKINQFNGIIWGIKEYIYLIIYYLNLTNLSYIV